MTLADYRREAKTLNAKIKTKTLSIGIDVSIINSNNKDVCHGCYEASFYEENKSLIELKNKMHEDKEFRALGYII